MLHHAFHLLVNFLSWPLSKFFGQQDLWNSSCIATKQKDKISLA